MESTTTEESLPTKRTVEIEATTVWFKIHGLLERMQQMLTRRYRDPRESDPDYGRRLRELEDQIAEIDREQSGFRMGDYHEGGGKETSWKDWVLGLVGLVIVAWLARISLQMETLSALVAEQQMIEKHLEATDSRVERLENHVYRGSP